MGLEKFSKPLLFLVGDTGFELTSYNAAVVKHTIIYYFLCGSYVYSIISVKFL